MSNIGYIISMKKGIARFIYRELCELERNNYKIFLFPTKLKPGLYNKKEEWVLTHFNPISILSSNVMFLFSRPRTAFSLLREAISSKTLVNLLIAVDYSGSMKRKCINQIHCHFGDNKLFIGYYCKKIIGLPLTVTIHAGELYQSPNPEMFKKALKYCDRIIAISDYNKKLLAENFGAPERNISVIRLFVEPKEDDISKYKKILAVGSFEERKGYDVLLKAVSLLKRDDFILWVAGEGRIDVRKMAKELGIEDRVVFFGHTPSNVLNVLYYACDFFCLPSKTVKIAKGIDAEGIPVVLMEAMSARKPVISTRHVGIPELVEEILVDEDDPEGLAKAIEFLLDNPEKYREMGKKNFEIIERKFSKKNLNSLIKVFENVRKN